MNILKISTNLYKYFLCISILFITLFLISFFFSKNEVLDISDITTSTISDVTEQYSINVDYPRFKNSSINAIITDYVYSYVKAFKEVDSNNKVLDIDYDLYYKGEYCNIVFNLDNTLSNIKNHNIIINTSKSEIAYISNLFEKDYLQNEINNLVFYKYSSDIYNLIEKSNINNFTYVLNDEKIDVYFNNIEFKNIESVPFISINLAHETTTYKEQVYDTDKKIIAFTFDDGPSEYTLEILKTLELNNSSATFFMLGNKMKGKENIINEVVKSNSEVGSHSYSHKYLTKLSEADLESELNSTTILYNEISKDNIKLLRPPYGSYNKNVLNNSAYPLILWNVDTKDWLVRNSNKIVESILDTVKDGDIVIMHDVYKETAAAIKVVLPKLKDKGFEVVSVSTLAKLKNYTLSPGSVVKNIK